MGDDDSPQLTLPPEREPFRRRPVLLPLEVVRALPSKRAAAREAIRLSHLPQGVVADALGIDGTHLSRALKEDPPPEARKYFPDDRNQETLLMQVTGFALPAQWSALQVGFRLAPLESELERENRALKQQLEDERRERQAIVKFLRQSKGLAVDE